MSSNAAPDDVLFSVDNFLTVLKCCATVLSLPCHLEDVTPLLHRFDSKAAAKGSPRIEVFNEFLDRPLERGPFVGAQPIPVAIKLLCP